MNVEHLLEDFEMNYPYKVVKKLGEATNGVLYQVVHTETQKKLTVKVMLNPFENQYKGHQVYREIKILNQLSSFKNNVFTPTVYDIILPSESVKTQVSTINDLSYHKALKDTFQDAVKHNPVKEYDEAKIRIPPNKKLSTTSGLQDHLDLSELVSNCQKINEPNN